MDLLNLDQKLQLVIYLSPLLQQHIDTHLVDNKLVTVKNNDFGLSSTQQTVIKDKIIEVISSIALTAPDPEPEPDPIEPPVEPIV